MSLQCIAFEVSLVQMLERVHKLQLTSREKTIMDNEVEGMPSIVWSGSFQFPILLFQLSEFCRRWSREIKCPIDQVENEERRWSRLPCHVSHVTICYLVLWLLDMLEWLRECSLLFVFDVIIQSSTTCLQSREPKWQSCQVLVCIICLGCCSCHPQPGSILIKGEEFVRFDWEMKFIFLHSRVFRASEHSLKQQQKKVGWCMKNTVQRWYATWCDEQPEKSRSRAKGIEKRGIAKEVEESISSISVDVVRECSVYICDSYETKFNRCEKSDYWWNINDDEGETRANAYAFIANIVGLYCAV